MKQDIQPEQDGEMLNERSVRLKKAELLKEQEINPYPAKTNKTHNISELILDFKNLEKQAKQISIAGRIITKRTHGNLTFANIRDGSGEIQIALSKKEIGADKYKSFEKLVDTADFVEITGVCFLTHKGQQSVMSKDWKMLSKTILPLPEKWHGLKDEDERFRKRYLDILTNPELKDLFVKKSLFWDTVRSFMKKENFFEVETPTLETTTGGAEANPFKTYHRDFDINVYLRISVGELWQKRLMAAGFEKTFEIGRVYRNEGSSPEHLQEFVNMEFYWAYADYTDGMKLAQKLYQTIAKNVFKTTKFRTGEFEYDLVGNWPKIDYRDTIKEKTGIDVVSDTEKAMKQKLTELGVRYEGENRERLSDTLWKYCRKQIAGPVFLVNHPKLVSPLAKASDKTPDLTERFQIIIAGSEVGNGYSELNDPQEQRKRFEEQQVLIDKGDEEAMMPDWEFVEMLEHGMPPTCGFGFGERLFAFMMNKTARECQLFPLMKPKTSIDNEISDGEKTDTKAKTKK